MASLPSQWSPWIWVLNTAITGSLVTVAVFLSGMSPTWTLEPGSITTTPLLVSTNPGLFMKPWLALVGISFGPWITYTRLVSGTSGKSAWMAGALRAHAVRETDRASQMGEGM